MKKPSAHLFQLIKSLNMSEKRYFKLNALRNNAKEQNVSIKLFDAIDDQRIYDEKAIRTLFSKESFVKRLNTAKQNLYEMILKSIDTFHTNNSVEARLRKDLHCIELLYEKGLFDQCKKIILRAKSVAGKHEHLAVLQQLIRWEVNLMRTNYYVGKTEVEIEKVFKQLFDTDEKQKNQNEYNRLAALLFNVHRKKGGLRAPSELKKHRAIMRHPLLSNEKKALTFLSLFNFYRCHALYAGAIKDNIRERSYEEKIIQLIENNGPITGSSTMYLNALYNFIGTQITLNNYSKAIQYFEKLKTIAPNSIRSKNLALQYKAISGLAIYIGTGQFNKGLALIKEVDKESMNQNNTALKKNTTFIYDVFCNYFGLEEYRTAKLWLNKILNDTNEDLRIDILCFARIMNLILHFELGDQEQLERIAKSTYKFLLKRERLYKVETAVFNFIRKRMSKINSRKELITAFKEVRSELIPLLDEPFEKNAFVYFDFISWLDSKIEKRSFADVLREKATITT